MIEKPCIERALLTLCAAQKYKDYTKVRDILSGKSGSQVPSSPQKHQSRKRKHESIQVRTPSKRQQIVRTPLRSATHPANVDPYDSPSVVRNLFTPAKNKVLGPTPQKDGQVLGLFDLMGVDDNSPSKAGAPNSADKLHETPRKPTNNLEVPTTGKRSRTPASSGKRFMLDAFATPLKGRHPNEQGHKTPSSVSKLHFSTPSFLRRDSHRTTMPSIDETDTALPLSPQMVRLPKKPLVRGLSSILASLRRMEEDALDDDLDALRDMESGPQRAPANKVKAGAEPVPIPSLVIEEAVLIEDSQVPHLLGGFDDEGKYDSEPEELKNPTLGRDGLPLKIWKKKGQKRTTRRVNMKPVRSKPSAKSNSPISKVPADVDSDSDNDNHHYDEDAVLETQQADMIPTEGLRNFDSDSGSEYTASEGGTRYRRPDQTKKRKVMGIDGTIRTKVRKVAAGAHANFKRLKLRNSGAKGGAAHNSRFRRKK